MNRLYQSLPHFFKVAAVNLFSYKMKRLRYGKKFDLVLKNTLAVDKTEEYKINLEKILEQIDESKYYNINSVKDFCSLPILNKTIVKKDFEKIVNSKYASHYFSTAGTTGEVLKFPVTQEYIHQLWARFWKFRIINGIKFRTWCAYIYGKPLINIDRKRIPFWVKDYPNKQLLLSYPHMNEDTIKVYLQQVKSNNIRWIHGYPSAVIYMASLIRKRHLEEFARGLNLCLVTVSSEVISDLQKKEIADVFRCKVRQLYGLTEGIASMFECEYSTLHIDETFSYVEFLPAEEKGYYRIIGSNYFNKAFPLLRYDTGDYACLYESGFVCRCGRKSRTVKEIFGRAQEFITLKNGTRLVTAPLIFRNSVNIIKAQIIQTEKGKADFYIIRNSEYCEKDENILKDEIAKYFGKDFESKFIYPDKLRVNSNGKTKFLISELKEY